MAKHGADAVVGRAKDGRAHGHGEGFLPEQSDDRTIAITASIPLGTAAALDIHVREALSENRVGEARTLVAAAEAVLAAQGQSATKTSATDISRIDVAAAKARIAVAMGDSRAAHAILVQAIESCPDAPALRVLMAEIMLATGRATDIRPVLHHLGRPPASGVDPLQDAAGSLDKKG